MKANPPLRADSVDDLAHAGIHRFDGGDGGGNDARVADHIGIREVHDVHIGLIGIDRRSQRARDFRFAHLRLQIIRGDLGAGDEASLLPRLGLLAPAVEEERDVRILLGFGDMVLT